MVILADNPAGPAPGRPLSGLERVWLVADRLAPPFVNQCVLTAAVTLEPARLEAAVALAAAAHPGLRVVLRGRLRETRWAVAGPPPPLRVLDATGWDALGPEGAPPGLLNTRLDPEHGPVGEVVLVRGRGAQPDRLVVRTNHAALDGRGTQLFIEDLLRAHDGEAPLGAEAGPTLDVELARPLAPGPRAEPPADAFAPTGMPTTAVGSTWRRLSVPPLQGPVLPRVVVALAALAREIVGDGVLRLGLPVDLRPHAADLRSTANLTGVALVELPAGGLSPDEAHALVAAAAAGPGPAGHILAADRLRGTPLWLMETAGHLAGRALHRRGRYPVSVSVSNLGRQAWRLGSAPVSAFWIAPASDGLPLFLTLAGNAASLELCATMPLALADTGRLDRFAARLSEALRA